MVLQYKYNGKELGEGIGLYFYGFRMYDASIGRFTGVDPISDQFAHVSVYNYAENRVPNGIDLWGLQFLDANVARIYIHHGGASLQQRNLHNPTNYRIYHARVISGTTENGGSYLTTSFPTKVGSLNFKGEHLNRRRAANNSSGSITEVARNRPNGGDARQKRKWIRQLARQGLEPGSRVITPMPTGSGGRGVGALWIFSEGLAAYNNSMVKNDLKTADAQFAMYGGKVETIVNDAVENGIIPSELQTGKILGDIANYVFQGEFVNTYDDNTFNQILQISQQLIIDNGIELNCDQCQQTQKK